VSAGNRIADYTFDHYLRLLDGPSAEHVPSADYTNQIDAYLDGSYVDYFGMGGAGTVYAWHNRDNPMDVTNDGLITPQDVLVVFNELNHSAFHDVTGQMTMPPPDPIPGFYDVNRDRYVTAIDALMAINYLNALVAGEGEGESESITFANDHRLLPLIPAELVRSDPDSESENSRWENREARAAPQAVFLPATSASSPPTPTRDRIPRSGQNDGQNEGHESVLDRSLSENSLACRSRVASAEDLRI
jgi:hypothetical protein